MKTNGGLTVYSKSVANGVEVWTRSAIAHAEWEDAEIANKSSSGVSEADRIIVFIPFGEGEVSIKPGDYLVKGIVADEISSSFTITALRKKYSDAAVVRAVNRMDFGSIALHHWQIGAN